MSVSELPVREGTLVGGRYRLDRLVGQGGMGSVWSALHVSLSRRVAVKFIRPELASSAEARSRFELEAKAAARIQSRHAVSVFDNGVTEAGQPYIVMEFLEGESLEQRLRRAGKLPLEELVALVEQAAEALSAAHEQGIVHRDLKPDNVFLARAREPTRFGYVVKLVDFGIAKVLDEGAANPAATTQAGVVIGTPQYMSPEALTAAAPVTVASDVWSLGACAFTAAVGSVPFPGGAIGDVVLKVCAAPLPAPTQLAPELPPGFDVWFAKACARSVAERFASARDAARALADLEAWARARRDTSAYELRPASLSELQAAAAEDPPASRRGLALASGLVGASIMLAALGYYVVTRTRAADAEASATAASARAIIEAENERRLAEAEASFWARQGRGGAPSPGPGPRENGRASQRR